MNPSAFAPIGSVANEVARVLGAWRAAPPVSVVPNVAALPVRAPADVRGLFRRGEVFVVEGTQSGYTAPLTLAHEALGHFAMRSMFGAAWRPFALALQAGARGGDSVLSDLRSEVRQTYIDDDGICTLSIVNEGDEVCAARVERLFNRWSCRLEVDQPGRALAAAAAGHLAREVLFMDRPLCVRQLDGALVAAERRLRHGDLLWGFGYRLRRWYSAPMPYDPKAPPRSWADQKDLLEAEDYRLQAAKDRKGLSLTVVLILSVVGLIFSIGFVVFGVAGKFASLF